MPGTTPPPSHSPLKSHRRSFLTSASAWSIAALVVPISGCATLLEFPETRSSYKLDTLVASPNQGSRVGTLVLHYTALPLGASIAILTDPRRAVSAHYVVPDAPDNDGKFGVFALVPESQLARHAGVSYWQGVRMLNGTSIGIEIVNSGFPAQHNRVPLMTRSWEAFGEDQIAAVGELARDIVARHDIAPHRVVAHADVAPGRKLDPGPLFPWRKLYETYGVGAWPDAEVVDYHRVAQPFDGDIGDLQAKLLAYGYDTPQNGELDARTVDVVSAFQMHFRPTRYDGVPDAETAAILDALLEKYFNRPRKPQSGPM